MHAKRTLSTESFATDRQPSNPAVELAELGLVFDDTSVFLVR
jgi:hypothetical protein